MKRFVLTAILCFALGGLAVARSSEEEDRKKTDERLQNAAEVLRDVMAAPDKGIPDDLLKKAHCAVRIFLASQTSSPCIRHTSRTASRSSAPTLCSIW